MGGGRGRAGSTRLIGARELHLPEPGVLTRVCCFNADRVFVWRGVAWCGAVWCGVCCSAGWVEAP